MKVIGKLLKQPSLFSRMSVFCAFIPFLLSFNQILSPIILASYLILTSILYANNFSDLIESFKTSAILFKLTYILYFIGVGVLLYVIDSLFDISDSFIILVLGVMVYYNWQNRIIDKLSQFHDRPVLKNEVIDNRYHYEIQDEIFILFVTLIVTIIIIVIDSFLSSNATEIFISSKLWWFSIFPIILIHVVIHYLVVDEIEWTTDDGISQFKNPDVDVELPSDLTSAEVSKYMLTISRMESPPDDFFPWFEDNLPELSKSLSQPQYAMFVHQIIYGFSYWGREVKDHIHLLHLSVISSLKKFHQIGKIPLYNRSVIFEYLALLYKLQVKSSKWELLIDFIIENNEEAARIGWINNHPWNNNLGKFEWMSYWENKIYRGRKGYNEIKEAVEGKLIPPEDGWKSDCWLLAYRVIHRFLGPEEGKMMEGDLKIIDALEFLVEGKTLNNFEIHKEKQIKELTIPTQRETVVTPIEKKSKLSDDEKKKRLQAYFDGNIEALSDSDHESFRQPLERSYNRQIRHILIYGGLAVAAYINMQLFSFLTNFITEQTVQALFGLECFILAILTMSGEFHQNEPEKQNTFVNLTNERAKNYNAVTTEYPFFTHQSARIILFLLIMALLR